MSIVGALLCVVVIAAWVAMSVLGNREQCARQNKIDSTRHSETINGKEYSVYTEKRNLVKEKRTGRIGIATEAGHSPGWMKVQFIRKSDGEVGRTEWRQQNKFEFIGTADLNFLSRQVSRFNTERLKRCRIDQTYLARSIRKPPQ
jgi:hypothetical protein